MSDYTQQFAQKSDQELIELLINGADWSADYNKQLRMEAAKRGIPVDDYPDENTPKRLKSCVICKKRSFDVERGVLCGLTGKKPLFEDNCPDYDLDAEEKERLKHMTSGKLSGFAAFYLYFAMPLGAIWTIINFLFTFNSANYGGSIFLMICDIVNLLFYIYFCVYTLYAFNKRKPDAVFIAKYQLIIVFATNLITLLVTAGGDGADADSSFRMVVSLIWTVVFFIALSTSSDVNYMIPKETRKLSEFNKTMVILSIAIPVLLLFFGMLQLTF